MRIKRCTQLGFFHLLSQSRLGVPVEPRTVTRGAAQDFSLAINSL